MELKVGKKYYVNDEVMTYEGVNNYYHHFRTKRNALYEVYHDSSEMFQIQPV
jgi:hypothetical protein